MKYLFTILLLLVVLLQTKIGQAQQKINYYPDSIRIELPEQHTLIVFEMRRYAENPAFIKNFPAQFDALMAYVKESTSDNFSETGPNKIVIEITPEGHYSTKPFVESTHFTIENTIANQTKILVKDHQIVELLPPGWEVYITAKEYKIKVYSETYQDLLSLSDLDLTAVGSKLEADAGMKNIGRKSIHAQMVLNQKTIEKSTINYVHPLDNIFINANAGVGLFQDKLYPELSFHLGLTFKDHFKRENIRTAVHYTNLFFAEKTEPGYTSYINSFLSLSFERNFNPNDDHAHWFGLGAGLLVRNKGDYFKGNTAKFFISHELGGRLNVVPEFYLTDDFKKFSFGMALKYSF